ncbi:MAG TPA: hypothetical protein VFS44_00225 [Gemmatimonadaceae bacterium]|nr:hypothetical protein [Gemmatimonadaceae bacterium]
MPGGSAPTAVAGSGADTPAPAPAPRGIFGEWVLFTAPDSTAFTGARRVELSLHSGTFAITAYYPDAPTLVVTGALAGDSSGGVLVLTPTAAMRDGAPATDRLPLVPGQPITMVASTAGNSLLFIPPDRVTREPSSVWHRCEKAVEAGEICR